MTGMSQERKKPVWLWIVILVTAGLAIVALILMAVTMWNLRGIEGLRGINDKG
jgi:hypothetical protein